MPDNNFIAASWVFVNFINYKNILNMTHVISHEDSAVQHSIALELTIYTQITLDYSRKNKIV